MTWCLMPEISTGHHNTLRTIAARRGFHYADSKSDEIAMKICGLPTYTRRIEESSNILIGPLPRNDNA